MLFQSGTTFVNANIRLGNGYNETRNAIIRACEAVLGGNVTATMCEGFMDNYIPHVSYSIKSELYAKFENV